MRFTDRHSYKSLKIAAQPSPVDAKTVPSITTCVINGAFTFLDRNRGTNNCESLFTVMILKFQDRASSFKSVLSILNYPGAKTTAEVFIVVHSDSLISKLQSNLR